MKELYLNYVDPEGKERRVLVEGTAFIVGRHSGCDLVIADSRLSREHIKIDRFADVFTVSDLNSSNGTLLNNEVLESPVTLEEDGVLALGGGVDISFVFETDEDKPEEEAEPAPPKAATPQSDTEQGSGTGLGLILIPLIGIVVLLFGGIGLIFYLSSGSTNSTGRGGDDNGGYSDDSDINDTPESDPTPEPQITPSALPTVVPGLTVTPEMGSVTPTPIGPDPVPTGSTAGGIDRQAEALVYSFMRKIAKNDQRPYLRTPNFNAVISQTTRYRGSGALAANIRNASVNASQIRSIASEKNIQPQFLAAAAITKLGNSRGNVAATASEMSGVLDRLTIVLGNELADDALLVIAAYNEGVAGNNLKMRDRLAGLARKNPTATPREIRTIWFLKEKGEISAGQYNFALNFLAVGTIAQNPQVFGVNAKALSFD